MSWPDLLRLGVTLRPFDNPPPSGETPSPFEAPFASTLEALRRELEQLTARKIVLQIGYRDADLRLDGMPRANARMHHNAVALSFESKWGPLRYETNEFVSRRWGYDDGGAWQHNLRAIALGMEALRKVDRYGVSKRGEQYTGWRQLTTSTDAADSIQSAEQARAYLQDRYGGDVKRALFESHPDHGGEPDEFRKVQRARELLGAGA